jgi:hypothetical protein
MYVSQLYMYGIKGECHCCVGEDCVDYCRGSDDTCMRGEFIVNFKVDLREDLDHCCVGVYMRVLNIYIYKCMYVCMYVYAYIYMYIYIYTYTHTHIGVWK